MNVASVRVAALVLPLAFVVGCSSNVKKAPTPPPPSYARLMQQANASANAQDIEGARSLFRKAAAADPTRKEPWYRLAQIDFDQQSYGRAIVDSQEVLQRDPSDTRAESILTVAGLRIATQALGRLHDETDLQGPAHVEAEKLAQMMRETLGQDVLVPPAPKKPVARRRSHVREAVRNAAPVETPQKQGASQNNTQGANQNPFQALPGGR